MQHGKASGSRSSLSKKPLSLFQGVGSRQNVALLATCAILAIGMQTQFPRYLSLPNGEVMLVNFVSEGIMALGMTIVMITGGIDISVAAVLQFSAILVGMLMNGGVPIPLAIVATLVAAALIGFMAARALLAPGFRPAEVPAPDSGQPAPS